MTYSFSEVSVLNMRNVHPDLIAVMNRSIELSDVDFKVICGSRTPEQQKVLFDRGASKTLNSRHLIGSDGYCHAVDVCALVTRKVSWNWPLYIQISDAVKRAANELNIPIVWGGDWPKFKDGGHFELPISDKYQ